MRALRWKVLPTGLDTAAVAAAAWARGDEVAWLEGGGHDELAEAAVVAFGPPIAVAEGDSPEALDALARLLDALPPLDGDPAELAPFPFRGGAIGFLAYECNQFFERVPADPRRVAGLTRVRFAAPSRFLLTKKGARAVYGHVGESRAELDRDLDDILRLAASPPPPAEPPRAAAVKPLWPRDRYVKSVGAILEHILAGDIYQANLSQPFEAAGADDPLRVHRRLLTHHPTPFAAFLGAPGRAVVSASPELFLRLRGSTLETRPIKGTRPRTGDPARDAAARQELDGSAKDRAELAMIVDLERNDLARVCRPGSVKVATSRALETYASVFHGVATVRGELRPGVGLREILAATFPSGSITGCPKIRAMEILYELEREPRGPTFGAVGWIGRDGDLDFNVAIRTMAFERTAGTWNAAFRTGGGIVVDSRPEDEYDESLVKAVALARALGDPQFPPHG